MPIIDFDADRQTGTIRLETVDDEVLGPAFRIRTLVRPGAIFTPATAADRDALVAYLNGIDFTASRYNVVLEHTPSPDEIYRVRAIKEGTEDDVAKWADKELKAMAGRLKISPNEITLTIDKITA